MKKLLALLMLVFPVMGMFNDVEMYSDERPKKYLVFQHIEQTHFKQESNPLERTISYVKHIFLSAGYVEIPLENKYKSESKDTSLFYCFVSLNSEEKHSFFIDLSLAYYRNTENPLGLIKVHVPCELNTWSYPIVVKGWHGFSKVCNEMSWKNISCILQNRFLPWVSGGVTEIIFENEAVEKLYKDITNYGLENCISRVLITKEIKDSVYNFYVLSNSEHEKEFHAQLISKKIPHEKSCALI
jgi:hypothetical protein